MSTISEPEPRPSLATFQQRDDTPRHSTATTSCSNATHEGHLMMGSQSEPPFLTSSRKGRRFFDRMLGRGAAANDGPSSLVSRPTPHQRTKSLNPNAFLTKLLISSPSPSTVPGRRSMDSRTPTLLRKTHPNSHNAHPSIQISPNQEVQPAPNLNTLTKSERAEKIRRNRKVLQIFGDGLLKRGAGPTGDIAFDQALSHPSSPCSPEGFDGQFALHKRPSQLLLENRRHSSPISPSFFLETPIDPRALRRPRSDPRKYGESVVSLSSDSTETEVATRQLQDQSSKSETLMGDQQQQQQPTPVTSGTPALVGSDLSFHSSDSMNETATNGSILEYSLPISSDRAPEDEERAKKRATLAKLHRFLGSRVPVDLVLGLTPSDVEASLPPKSASPIVTESGPSALSRAKSWKNFKSHRSAKRSNSGEANGERPGVKGEDSEDKYPVVFLSDGELDARVGRLTHAQRNDIVRKKKKITKMMGDCPPDILNRQSSSILEGKDLLHFSKETGKSLQYVHYRYSIDSLTYLMQKKTKISSKILLLT
ncbi:uncharacterized protein EI90DRAFT_3293622 [Cantharellus anzutake]|uniref:uncharacterized protein n=1 Tax=Cantharellus anzutake TaxID=1750568 RepID=UPI00190325BA|nr:uncharacterized protein EI90DRAFT_3293622 [Cantharellus anzutake]KAF8316708.1 hypothetical protein EI90DRAFT_3293622 [Cantharellus anzutake]